MNVVLRARLVLIAATCLLAGLSLSPPLLAQTPVRVTIPGAAFKVEGRADEVRVDNVAGGQRFRGKAFASVIVRTTLQMPPATSADPKMQRLVIHFRTSASGPSLRSVELRNGSNAEFHLQMQLSGDYTARETTQPASVANTWAFDQAPIRVSAQSVLRLEFQFPGGFDSPINAGEFVITSAVVDFPRKAAALPTTVTSPTNTTAAGRGRPTTTAERTTTPALRPVPPALAGATSGVIYAVSNGNELLWYRHTGSADGSATWAAPQGKTVGTGWDFKQVFSGGDGVIYAITASGDLLWYRHDGRADGSFTWALSTGRKIGSGWDFAHVFYGGDGVIYAIAANGDLLWYRHDGRGDGNATWAAPQGKVVGSGWNVKDVFAGGNGVIYVVNSNNELVWYRHDGRGDGSFRWAASQGKTVGTGWDVTHVFSAGDGVIYAVMPNGDLVWNRHEGRADGTATWAAPQGKKVGSGWTFKTVFSGDRQ